MATGFKEHSKAGIIASMPAMLITAYLFRNTEILFYIFMIASIGAVAWYGSLAPDLDTCSLISRWTARALIAYTALSLLKFNQPQLFQFAGKYATLFSMMTAFYANAVFVLIKCSKHRGFTHKYITPIALIVIAYFTGYPWFAALGYGFIVHDLVDHFG